MALRLKMASTNSIIRRSVRLLTAIHELHKQGFQNLAIYCYMSPSGFHWRLELCLFSDLYILPNGDIKKNDNVKYESAKHSSGESGNIYFGWEDVKTATARELAEHIKNRFPRLCDEGQSINFAHVGWYTYMLGIAETGALPSYFRDYSVSTPGKVMTTKDSELIIAPPYKTLQSVNGLNFLWADAPEVHPYWHDAYQPLIDNIRIFDPPRYPQYPSHTDDLYSYGAYWEGAIYYLKTVMKFESEADYIRERINNSSSDKWTEFDTIYNSEGQVHLLDAHLARVALESQRENLSIEDVNECKKSIRDVKLMYQEYPCKFPNPFFGGGNPLHLALLSDAPP